MGTKKLVLIITCFMDSKIWIRGYRPPAFEESARPIKTAKPIGFYDLDRSWPTLFLFGLVLCSQNQLLCLNLVQDRRYLRIHKTKISTNNEIRHQKSSYNINKTRISDFKNVALFLFYSKIIFNLWIFD
jgi:hypothetical protein